MTSIQQRDAQTVLAAIDEVLPALRERAPKTEELRRLTAESVADLEQAGFFKLLQPEQWGGLQCDPTMFFEAVRRIASACGSTGWATGILGVHNWHLAQFDQQAQEDVWGADPSVRISSSYAPMGAGQVVDGGYLVNGTWLWSRLCSTSPRTTSPERPPRRWPVCSTMWPHCGCPRWSTPARRGRAWPCSARMPL
jgi:3-hydroxy-9,10-secoandrosta-1,3,5(10)-triene-9,17-dione monooxygenase